MKFIDAQQLPPDEKIDTDICIIGSGAAGTTLALELEGSSQKICLLESGQENPNDLVQSLYDMECIGFPIRKNFQNRIRQYGGSCNIWPGRTMVLNEIDIQPRAWVEDSGWPIQYSELQRYYQKASKYLGIPEINYFQPSLCQTMMSKDESTFLRTHQLTPNISLWAKHPARFGMKTSCQKEIEASVAIMVYVNATVTEIETFENFKCVKSVKVSCLNGNHFTVRGKVFILACGGLENPRLLLASRRQISKGLGNQYDIVGKYFMEHPKGVMGRVRLNKGKQLPTLIGQPLRNGKIKMGLRLSENLQSERGLLNCYVCLEPEVSSEVRKGYESFIRLMKRLLRKGYSGKRLDFKNKKLPDIPNMIYELPPRELMPHWVYYLQFHLKKILYWREISHFRIMNYCEQEPNPGSRVFLSEKKDRLGMNKLVLDWKIGKKERASILEIHRVLNEHLKSRDMGSVEASPERDSEFPLSDASHHMGTTRMSTDPKKGVVDTDCRVHNMNNLYVAGSSVFPTSGHANPTLTIVALSIRLGEHIKGNLHKA